MVGNSYLSGFIIRQFDIKKFKEMIQAFISLVDNFQRMIDDEDYYIKYTANYEVRVGGNRRPTNSKIESFLISKYDTLEKKQELLLKYKVALNYLNELERKVFVATFVEKKSNLEISEEFLLYFEKLSLIRKSAIVKFSLKLGFEKFVNTF